jgi:hypothetical protein
MLAEARALEIDLPQSTVRIYKRWLSEHGICHLGDSSKIDSAFLTCISDLVDVNDKHQSIEEQLARKIYGDIFAELKELEDFSRDIRSQIITDGTQLEITENLFNEGIDGIKYSDYEKLIVYFMYGAIPIVSVVPVYTHDIAYYNPIIDAVYMVSVSKNNGKLEANSGYFILGAAIRGQPVADAPSWLQQDNGLLSFSESFDQMVFHVGMGNIYKANINAKADDQHMEMIYARILSIMKEFQKQKKCHMDTVAELRTNTRVALRRSRHTNIDKDTAPGKLGEYNPYIYLAGKMGLESTYLKSAAAPEKSILVQTNTAAACAVEGIYFIDEKEKYKSRVRSEAAYAGAGGAVSHDGKR